MLGSRLDFMILKVFSNPNDPMILFYKEKVMKEVMYKMAVHSETKPEKPGNQRVETPFFNSTQ